MKKSFFYFVMAAGLVLGTYSCSKDSTDETPAPKSETGIPAPPFASSAVAFNIPKDAVKAKNESVVTETGEEVSVCLTGVDITESRKAIFEVTTVYSDNTTKLKYVTYDVSVEGNVYKVKNAQGTVIGTIENVGTRASSSTYIIISVTISIPGIGEITFVTDNPVVVEEVVEAIVETVNTISLARNWTVTRMKLILTFDDPGKTDASRIENGGNLHNFIELAENNGVSLTEHDKEQLNKVITGVSIDKSGLFAISYNNGGTDAANWKWANSSQNLQIQITLKDGDMGNKFLKDNSIVDVQLYPETNQCILILNTRLEEDKCTASLQMTMM